MVCLKVNNKSIIFQSCILMSATQPNFCFGWGTFPLSTFTSYPFAFHLLSLPSHWKSLFFIPITPSPQIQLDGLRERCKLPQWVRAEPGHQTASGAIWGKNCTSLHMQLHGIAFVIISYVIKRTCAKISNKRSRQVMPQILLRTAISKTHTYPTSDFIRSETDLISLLILFSLFLLFFLLGRPSSKKRGLRRLFKSDRDEIWQDCSSIK